MPREHGYSLIELMIAVGIIAMVTATGVGLTLASRSLAVASAATEFDQLLDSARTIARGVGGGNLVFAPDGDGTTVSLSAPGIDGTLLPTTLPALHTAAHIAEQEVLGDPAFTLVLHADGRVGGIPNAASAEVGCPASGAYHFHISAGGGSADRFLPCRITLATSGTLTYTGWPAATAAPSPVASCAGTCTPPQLPTPPAPAPSCPSGTSPAGTSCVPVPVATPTPTAAATATPTAVAVSPPTPTPTSTPTPTVVACDLVQNGTCYHRIQGPTLETFYKEVDPGYTCDPTGMTCQWANTVGRVLISSEDSYSFQPQVAPKDTAHQLLFVIDGVAGLVTQCISFMGIVVSAPSPPISIPWYNIVSSGGYGNLLIVGSPGGYGQPAIFANRHNVVTSSFPISGALVQSDSDATQYSQTIDQFISAVQQPLYGPTVSWTYSDPAIVEGTYVTYVPDFTGCASGLPEDHHLDDQLYGNTTAVIVVEVYQAISQ